MSIWPRCLLGEKKKHDVQLQNATARKEVKSSDADKTGGNFVKQDFSNIQKQQLIVEEGKSGSAKNRSSSVEKRKSDPI